jgi:chromate transport protein ChrA
MEEQDSQKLISQLVNSIDKAYHRTGLLMWRSFLMGLMSGLGATVGVAIVITVIGLLIKEFGGLPVVGQWLGELKIVLPNR